MKINSSEVTNYNEYLTKVSGKVKELETSGIPVIQQEVNSKYPRLTMEVGNGIPPIHKVTNLKILKEANPGIPAIPKTPKLITKISNKTPVNTISKDISGEVIKYLFNK